MLLLGARTIGVSKSLSESATGEILSRWPDIYNRIVITVQGIVPWLARYPSSQLGLFEVNVVDYRRKPHTVLAYREPLYLDILDTGASQRRPCFWSCVWSNLQLLSPL